MRKYVAVLCLLAPFVLSWSSPSFAATNTASDGYAVQVSACRMKLSADTVVNALRKDGYTPYVEQLAGSAGRPWYLVRLGDYPTLKEAKDAAGAYASREGKEAVVTRATSMQVLARKTVRIAETASETVDPPPKAEKEKAASSNGAEVFSPADGENTTPPKTVQIEEQAVEQRAAPSSEPSEQETSAAAQQAVQPVDKKQPRVMVAENQEQNSSGSQEAAQEGSDEHKAPASAVAPAPATELEKRLESVEEELKTLREQAEARKKLEVTTEEKEAKEKEVLSAAGREYTLLKKNTLGVEYNFSYAYYSYDVLREAARIESHSNHNLTNAVFLEYAVMDNLTVNTNLPFVYEYDRTGTSDAKDVNDLGDISLGAQWQPFKSGGTLPTMIFQGTFTVPSGQSPYEINPDSELDTGSGYYSAGAGVTFSHTVDPIVAFGNLNYNYNFEVESLNQQRAGRVLTAVDPGDSISLGLGMGYALSYKVNLNLSYQYTYHFATKYQWRGSGTTSSGTYSSSLFSIGTGWRISPKRSVYLKVGIGLTNDDPDFTFSFRLPFQFAL